MLKKYKINEFNKVLDNNKLLPLFLLVIITIGNIAFWFNNNVMIQIVTVIISLTVSLFFYFFDFNNSLILLVSLIPFQNIGKNLYLFNFSFITINFCLFTIINVIKYVFSVIKKEEKIFKLPFILTLLCICYGSVNFCFTKESMFGFVINAISFAFIYLFFINSKHIKLKKITLYFCYSLISSIIISLLYYSLNLYTVFFSNRFQALTWNPNSLQMMCILLISYLTILYFNKLLKFELYAIYVLIFILAGLFTMSKAFLLLILAIALYILIFSFKKSKKTGLIVTCGFIIFVFFIFVFMKDYIDELLQRFNVFNTSNALDNLFTGRITIWQNYLQYLKNNIFELIFGCGLGMPLLNDINPHNAYLYLLYYYGIFGMVLIVSLIVSYVLTIKKNKAKINLSGTLAIIIIFFLCFEETLIADFEYLVLILISCKFMFFSGINTKQNKSLL